MSDVCGVCGQPGWKGHPLTEGYHDNRNECVYALTKALQAEQERSAGLYEALQAFDALFAEIEAKAKEQEREIQTARERVAELEQELLYFRMDEADSL